MNQAHPEIIDVPGFIYYNGNTHSNSLGPGGKDRHPRFKLYEILQAIGLSGENRYAGHPNLSATNLYIWKRIMNYKL